MSKKKPTVEERAVRGVLGGWVCGHVQVNIAVPDVVDEQDGGVWGSVYVTVPAESVKKMLADERKAAKKGKRK